MGAEKIFTNEYPERYIYKSGKLGNKTFVVGPLRGKDPYEDFDCVFIVEGGKVRNATIDEICSDELTNAIPATPQRGNS